MEKPDLSVIVSFFLDWMPDQDLYCIQTKMKYTC